MRLVAWNIYKFPSLHLKTIWGYDESHKERIQNTKLNIRKTPCGSIKGK
jgi:hypothetical protein